MKANGGQASKQTDSVTGPPGAPCAGDGKTRAVGWLSWGQGLRTSQTSGKGKVEPGLRGRGGGQLAG